MSDFQDWWDELPVELPTSAYDKMQMAWNAALDRAPQQWQAWQDISTAPRDGKAILICSGRWMTVGSWVHTRNRWVISSTCYDDYPSDEQPTHWQLLPQPPKGPDHE
jgi:hypothetical protein